jgi:hypothetical protein
LVLSRIVSWLEWTAGRAKKLLRLSEAQAAPGKWGRSGLVISAGLLLGVGLWLLAIAPANVFALGLIVSLDALGIFNLAWAFRRTLTLGRANQLSLLGHMVAVVSLYVVASRFVMVSYLTDTIVATYLGVLKVVALQSPYGFSIKPLLDQFGFSPSFYTPGVDGSFDFHLAYPSLSFLSVLPFYLIGVRDLRDGIFIFHLASVLAIFALVPSKFKSASLAPFGLFSFVIAGSWTDSVWAFFLVVTALTWYRHPKASWASLGLAVAAKQIALVVAPFLLIRLWHETPTLKIRAIGKSLGIAAMAFILPNLPFIAASPSSWWKDIVAPYLPGTPSQIPGGIGLSNFLLDVGIALPSSFFIVLMLSASAFLLYAYARHYQGLNSMVFAFPIFLFFFYYRSFPNYMAYWLFPLVFELCRLGGPNIRALFTAKLPTIPWSPSTSTIVKLVHRRLTPSVMVVLSLTVAFVGVSGAYISQASTAKTTIQINGVMDPDSIGAATLINVTIMNLLSTPVSPTFFVKWGPLPYYWTTNSSAPLAGGASNAFLIEAPDGLSAIPRGDPFHIVIYDRLTGQLLGESAAAKADIATPPLSNPGLKWWALDASVGKKVPFGWKLSLANTDLSTSKISPLGFNGTAGVQLTLNYTALANGIESLALSQKALLNATSVIVHFNQSFVPVHPGKAIFATSITDGTHTLYFVFSNRTTVQTVTTFPTNTTVLVPASTTGWNSISLSPQAIWVGQGWTLPVQVTITLFIESNSPGIFYASVSSVN